METTQNLNKREALIYRITTTLVVLIFFVTGVANLIRLDHLVHDISKLGYPPYFTMILGTWKLIGAFVIVLPALSQWKELAYAGMLIDLSSAAFSRLAVGDSLVKVLLPLVISAWVILSWKYSTKKTNIVFSKHAKEKTLPL